MKTNKTTDQSAEQLYQIHLNAINLFAVGDINQGTQILLQLLRLDPKDPHVDHIKGFILCQLGLHEEAIPLLRRAAGLLPQNRTEPRLTLAIAMMGTGRLSEAESLLEVSLANAPHCPLSQMSLAVCLLELQKTPERVEQLLREADRRLPNTQALLANLGRALALQGKVDEADMVFKRAIALAPDSSIVATIIAFYPHLARRPATARPFDPSLN